MKIRFTLLFIFVIAAFAACTKPQEKLEGTWHFSKVTQRTGMLSSMDITDRHDAYQLHFYPGGVLVQRNTITTDSLTGNWMLNKIRVDNGEESTTEQLLVLTFPESSPILDEITILNETNISNQVIRGYTNDSHNRVYRKYVLRKR